MSKSGERELSIYVPSLGGNLHFFVFESRHIQDAAAFLAKRPVWQPKRQVSLRLCLHVFRAVATPLTPA